MIFFPIPPLIFNGPSLTIKLFSVRSPWEGNIVKSMTSEGKTTAAARDQSVIEGGVIEGYRMTALEHDCQRVLQSQY